MGMGQRRTDRILVNHIISFRVISQHKSISHHQPPLMRPLVYHLSREALPIPQIRKTPNNNRNPSHLREDPTPPPRRAPLATPRLAADEVHVIIAVLDHLGDLLPRAQRHRDILLIATRDDLALRLDRPRVLEQDLLEIVVDVALDDNVLGVVLRRVSFFLKTHCAGAIPCPTPRGADSSPACRVGGTSG